MANISHKLRSKKPRNIFNKPLEADFKELFKALGNGVAHFVTGQWVELTSNAIDAVSSLGFGTDPAELAFLLIRRSVTKAIFELIGENIATQLAENNLDPDTLLKELDFSPFAAGVELDHRFLDHPTALPFVNGLQVLLRQWLKACRIAESAANAISNRFPSYFVYALNQEWRGHSKSYTPLVEALATPFMKAGEREWAWSSYAASLEQKVNEAVFDESFSLRQIYIPLNASYVVDPVRPEASDKIAHDESVRKREVVSIQDELQKWLQDPSATDAIRVISGGPGSGKSSFARIFAADVATNRRQRVLFVPLHLIDPTKDLVEEVGRFVAEEGILRHNPLDPQFA